MTKPRISETISRLLPKPSQIEDDIQEHTMADYNEAKHFYVETIQKCPGVHFLGQFGSIGTPGVSDIDILVIAEEEHFHAVRQESRRLIQKIPNGPYLFWHWEVMLPKSLVEISCALRTFEHLQVLWGDASLLKSLTVSYAPLSVIMFIVWNSHLWRSVTDIRRARRLRFLMLLLNNIVQSLAADFRILGQMETSDETLAWGKEIRNEILSEPAHRRQQATVYFYEKVIHKWWQTDWQVQQWWCREVRTARCENAFQFHPGLGKTIRFQQEPESNNNSNNSLWKSLARISSKINRNVVLELPSFYLQIALAVRDAFPPSSMPSSLYYADSSCEDSGWNDEWQKAIATYKKAVQSVQDTAIRMNMEPSQLITDPFMSPFGINRG